MDLLNIIKQRKSERNFSSKKIERSLMLELLEAGRLAPSACNYQPWRFVVVDEPSALRKICEAYPRNWFAAVPQVIVVCGDHRESWKRASDSKDHCDVDVAIAIDHITLMAESKELGTCWVCSFNTGLVSEALQLPEYMEPVALLPIGYPAEKAAVAEKNRKPLEEIVFYNSLDGKL
ncbi:MAG: nitroreductase family protein [Cytophagaceae bacterium]|jgi:nitroreductase|nr:nitroreductase family protein [Cytophagaceae bacterium]